MNDEDPLDNKAKGYFRYFLENGIVMKVSTISIVEYCVRGTADELPIRNIHILSFNMNHAVRIGEFTAVIFEENRVNNLLLTPRPIIPNGFQTIAQAELDK